MSMTVTVLDLFCGAGGAAKGYQRAGFHVVGVDKYPQPRYAGDDFIEADAMDFLADNWWRFDAIHASPPCQRYSVMSHMNKNKLDHPDMIPKLRAWLRFYNKPFVIENVPGAPMVKPVELCGLMFGFDLYRHRLFETNFRLPSLPHPWHKIKAVHPDSWEPGLILSVVGNCAPIAHARKIMDIDWMPAAELSQAIPPYYTEYIGQHLMKAVRRLAKAG